MAMESIIRTHGFRLSAIDEGRIEHHLNRLERRLVHHPEPSAMLVLTQHRSQRQIEVDLRIELGPLGSHLISHQGAETVDRAVRLAVEDVERQLERHHAQQSGEPTFGVPSRRLPRSLRPARFPSVLAEEEEEEEEGKLAEQEAVELATEDDSLHR
jgi:ribosome-associated translation inhibitor RaiA